MRKGERATRISRIGTNKNGNRNESKARFGVRRQSAAATALSKRKARPEGSGQLGRHRACESGVPRMASGLPPQSKNGGPKRGEETRGRQSERVDLEAITNWDELAERAGTDPKTLARLCATSLECAVSLRTLERFFEKQGTTPEAFLMKKLHERCLAHFKEGLSVKEVADKARFVDQFAFSRSFKKHIGVPPSTFRMNASSRREGPQDRSPTI